MTKPKNIRPNPRGLSQRDAQHHAIIKHLMEDVPNGAHISSPGVVQPVVPHINTVEVGALQFADAPGLVMVRLLIDGKPLYLPARLMTNMPGWVALQLQPQFPCFFTESDAEQFHQQQVAQMAAEKQAQAVALWTPDKARKGLVN